MDIEKLRQLDVVRQFINIENEESSDAVSLIIESIKEVSFSSGDTIVEYGAKADDGMYLIVEGTADVFGQGGEKINELGDGDIIGELALITDSRRAASVKATSHMICANITKQIFEENALKNKKIYGTFMGMLYKRTTSLVAQRERIKSELDVAARIQRSQLTRDFDVFSKSKVDIFADMLPAKQVGGDFYDAFYIGEDRICFLVADVSGKGVPAAMFMTLAKTNIRNFASMGLSLSEIVSKTNNQLCDNNEANMFVTAFICEYNLKDKRLEYINAGHNRPYIFNGNTWQMIECKTNLVLGIMPDMPYVQESVDIGDNLSMFMYTDGVTEALNLKDEFLGEEGLEEYLGLAAPVRAKKLVEDVFGRLKEFSAGAEQSDDITMLVFSNMVEG